jgi:hypothetical protein
MTTLNTTLTASPVAPFRQRCCNPTPPVRHSVYSDWEKAANEYKWIESEKAGRDLGEGAIRGWVRDHWCGYLRARWIEHLEGKCFWIELDGGDFGLLQNEFKDCPLLLDRILDRLKAGQENLDVVCWAYEWGIPHEPVLEILAVLDINSKRLVNQFESNWISAESRN